MIKSLDNLLRDPHSFDSILICFPSYSSGTNQLMNWSAVLFKICFVPSIISFPFASLYKASSAWFSGRAQNPKREAKNEKLPLPYQLVFRRKALHQKLPLVAFGERGFVDKRQLGGVAGGAFTQAKIKIPPRDCERLARIKLHVQVPRLMARR